MADVQLKTLLNAAKRKPCNFVLAAKGSDVALILSRKTIAAALVKQAKTKAGGGKIYIGVVQGGSDGFTFTSPRQVPGGVTKAVRQYIKRETGLTIAADFE
jgi:hypothetical protein